MFDIPERLRHRHLPPLSKGKVAQPDPANGHSQQAQGRQANRGGHMPDLTFLALAQHDLEPGRWAFRGDRFAPLADRRRLRQRPRLARLGDVVLDLQSAPQRGQGRLGRHTLDLGPVSLGQLVTRIGQAVDQRALVREQQQALAVVVEAARGVDPGRQAKLAQGAFAGVGVA